MVLRGGQLGQNVCVSESCFCYFQVKRVFDILTITSVREIRTPGTVGVLL